MNPDLSSSGGEFRIPPDAALDVVLTLSMPAQVDGVRVYMDVHEVVDNLTLNVVLNTVYQEPPTHIHHFNKGKSSRKEMWMIRHNYSRQLRS